MANITVVGSGSNGFNMETHFEYFIDVSIASESVISFTTTQLKLLLPDTTTLTMAGNFVLGDDGGPDSGTVTSVTHKDAENATLFSATGLSVSIATVNATFIDPETDELDVSGLIAYALRGVDTLTGSTGNDTLLSYNGNDTINGGAGVDVLYGGGGADILKGDSSDDTLYGENGADTLNGGTGNDILIGGMQNDTYIVGNAEDSITEGFDGGTDTVRSSVTFVLEQYVENLVLTGTGATNGTGNDDANTMTGNAGANILDGAGGNDVLIGLAGNDTYHVDSATDTVTEVATGGADIVYSSAATFTLPVNLERLIINAAGNANGIGNAVANRMDGNDFANNLQGMDGNDVIYGNGGNDALFGGNGNDRLLGGSGNDGLHGLGGVDRMEGGAGNDGYWAEVPGDLVIEAADAGTDTLYANFTIVLGNYPNVENLILTGSAAINGTGTAGSNNLTGNSGNNVLNGGGGGDSLTGGLGNDVLLGGNGDDSIFGGAGNDSINGGPGFDTMEGGAGNDSFIFNTALTLDTNNSVIDFNESGVDKLVLDKTVFAALPLNAGGTLAAASFVSAAADPTPTAANDFILYASGTGNLYYDADGNGAGEAVQFANISGGPELTAADFQIIA